jgi:hypothetical protein
MICSAFARQSFHFRGFKADGEGFAAGHVHSSASGNNFFCSYNPAMRLEEAGFIHRKNPFLRHHKKVQYLLLIASI